MKKGISFESVSLSYEEGTFKLKDINLFIPKGSFFGITGVNGSGKSTMTLLINGLIPHQIKADIKGQVYVDGVSTSTKPVSYFAALVGMVFQNPDFMLFNLTVAEEIMFGLKNLKLNDTKGRITKALGLVGMEGYEERDPQTLSLGQKQKICLAAVLAQDPSYIVLDEPVAMLDYKGSNKIFSILEKLNKAGKTIIVVEHDSDYLMEYADRMVVIDGGQIVEEGSPKTVFAKKEKLKRIGIRIPGTKL
jgi:energy-coupling factor transport system ATP-binding protein